MDEQVVRRKHEQQIWQQQRYRIYGSAVSGVSGTQAHRGHRLTWITAGVDTQDNRLEVQIVGWGRGLRSWTLAYEVLDGDPNLPAVWEDLADYLNTPIEHSCGTFLPVSATAIDSRGHRTIAVKNFVNSQKVRRAMAIGGAKSAAAPILSNPQYIIQALTAAGKEYMVEYHGLNAVDNGNPVLVRYFRVQFSPTSGFVRQGGDDFAELTLTMTILADQTRNGTGLSQYMEIAMV